MNRPAKKNIQIGFSISERLRSFRHAFSGIKLVLEYEHNARIHLVILIIVVITGFLTRISSGDWIAILVASGLVFISECFNTAVENLADIITVKQDENIRRAKDVAAAGVLLAAVFSVIIGLIIFIPALSRLAGSMQR